MEAKPSIKIYYITGILFIFFLILGLIFGTNNNYATQFIQNSFGYLGAIKNTPDHLLFLFIFANNTFKAFLVIATGIFFGLFPLYFVASNAFIIGVVTAYVAQSKGILAALVGMLPHGILELPTVLLAVVYGLWIGASFIRSLKTGKSINSVISYCTRNFFRIIVPALFIAALIETFVTPKLMNLVVR